MVCVLLLLGIGLTMVYSASSVYALIHEHSTAYFFEHQLVAGVIGLLCMAIIMNIRFQKWSKVARLMLLVNLTTLFLVIIPHIGHSRAGDLTGGRRWLGVGNFLFQPSEIAVIGMIIYLAYILAKKTSILEDFKHGVLPVVIVAGIVFGLIVLEKDFGTALVVLGTSFCMIFVSGVPIRHIGKTVLLATPVVVLIALFPSYRRDRLISFFHPHAAASGLGWQLKNSLFAINSGGWFGRGLGQSIEKFLWLPDAHTDFIFAILAEEWGIIGSAIVIGLFAIVIWRGIMIANQVEDRFGSLLAVGVTAMIGVGVIINLFAITGLVPVTGIPLPFISYGGTALVFKLAAVGMLLNVSRYTVQKETAPRQTTAKRRPLNQVPQTK